MNKHSLSKNSTHSRICYWEKSEIIELHHVFRLLNSNVDYVVKPRGRIASCVDEKKKLITDFDVLGVGHKRGTVSSSAETCMVNKNPIQFFLELVLELRLFRIPKNRGNPLR